MVSYILMFPAVLAILLVTITYESVTRGNRGGYLAIAKVLPTYHAADLGWQIANGQAPELIRAIVLALWVLLFLRGAAIFARRAARV